MDKSLKICKYQLKTSLKSIFSYYLIFCIVIGVLSFASIKHEDFTSSGLELSTAIFIFVLALNYFRGPFYFSQGSNISRKSFIKGSIMAGGIISAVLPIIDITINRIYNLFVNCAMNYDMIYGKYVFVPDSYGLGGGSYNIVINNSIPYLFKNYLFLFAALIFIFALGFLISTLYFRLSKMGQIIFSVIPIVALILFNGLNSYVPARLTSFVQYIFAYTNQNSLMAVLTLIILSTFLLGGQYLLAKRAEPNK